MALYKAFTGKSEYLDSEPRVSGHAYFCIDDGSFYIDYTDPDDETKVLRNKINFKELADLDDKSENNYRLILELSEGIDAMQTLFPKLFLDRFSYSWETLPDRPFGNVLVANNTLFEVTSVNVSDLTGMLGPENFVGDPVADVTDILNISTFPSQCIISFKNSEGTIFDYICNLENNLLVGSTDGIVYAGLIPDEEGRTMLRVSFPMNDTYDITISDVKETFKQIDEIYIPDSIVHTKDFTWENLQNNPFNEEVIDYETIWEGEATFTASGDVADAGFFSIVNLNLDPTKTYVLTSDGEEHGEFICSQKEDYTEVYTNTSTDDYFKYIVYIFENAEELGGELTPVVTLALYNGVGQTHYISIREKSHTSITHVEDNFISDNIMRTKDFTWENLQNKPFGELIPDSIGKGQSLGKWYDTHSGISNTYSGAEFKNGHEYLISINDSDNMCVCKCDGSSLYDQMNGNRKVVEFEWITNLENSEVYGNIYFYVDREDNYDIEIFESTSQYTTINDMYISDNIARKTDIPTMNEILQYVTENLPAAENYVIE